MRTGPMIRVAAPVALFAVVVATHCMGVITSYDSRWSIPTARSLLREGNTDLNEYAALLEANRFYAIEIDRRPSLLAVPHRRVAPGPPGGARPRCRGRGAGRRKDRAGDRVHRRRPHRRAALSRGPARARRAGLAPGGADLRVLHRRVVDGDPRALAARPLDADADARAVDPRPGRERPRGPPRRTAARILLRHPTDECHRHRRA